MKPEIGECSITINNVLRLEEEVKQLQSALKLCVEAIEFGRTKITLGEIHIQSMHLRQLEDEALSTAKPLLETP